MTSQPASRSHCHVRFYSLHAGFETIAGRRVLRNRADEHAGVPGGPPSGLPMIDSTITVPVPVPVPVVVQVPGVGWRGVRCARCANLSARPEHPGYAGRCPVAGHRPRLPNLRCRARVRRVRGPLPADRGPLFRAVSRVRRLATCAGSRSGQLAEADDYRLIGVASVPPVRTGLMGCDWPR